jgi:hypothetical protein
MHAVGAVAAAGAVTEAAAVVRTPREAAEGVAAPARQPYGGRAAEGGTGGGAEHGHDRHALVAEALRHLVRARARAGARARARARAGARVRAGARARARARAQARARARARAGAGARARARVLVLEAVRHLHKLLRVERDAQRHERGVNLRPELERDRAQLVRIGLRTAARAQPEAPARLRRPAGDGKLAAWDEVGAIVAHVQA